MFFDKFFCFISFDADVLVNIIFLKRGIGFHLFILCVWHNILLLAVNRGGSSG